MERAVAVVAEGLLPRWLRLGGVLALLVVTRMSAMDVCLLMKMEPPPGHPCPVLLTVSLLAVRARLKGLLAVRARLKATTLLPPFSCPSKSP